MMSSDTIHLSQKKVAFYELYSDMIKIVYDQRINKYGEKVKGSIKFLCFSDKFNVHLLKKQTRILDLVKDADEILKFESENELADYDFDDSEFFDTSNNLTVVQCYFNVIQVHAMLRTGMKIILKRVVKPINMLL